MHFCLFLSLCWTASRPYRLSHINGLHINQSKNQFRKKSLKIGNFEKLGGFFESAILEFFSKEKKMLHFYENPSMVHGYQGGDKILIITLIRSQKSPIQTPMYYLLPSKQQLGIILEN